MLFFWWTALLPLLCLTGGSSGEEKAEEVTGALGESVAFRLKVSEPFKTVNWLRTSDLTSIAVLKLEEECSAIVMNPNFEERLNISKDCKSLRFRILSRDDSGRYRAEIHLLHDKRLLNLFFELRVYKRLSEGDLSIRCKGIGNSTWRLNCSAEPWEDGVKFSTTLGIQREDYGGPFDVWHNGEEDNLNITCTAQNPISTTSKTESLKKVCNEEPATRSTTGPTLQNENGPPPNSLAAIVVVVVVLTVIVACGVALFWCKKRKGDSRQPPGSADSGGCNTIYARVGDVVEDRDSHHSQPRTQPSKQKPKTAQTIYTTVDHACKPNPLQTDDEKMQKGRRRAPEPREKTIYSEITTEPQEDEDQSLKTVYETVKNPKPPKGQEYDKII